MADNYTTNPGTGGDTFAADDVTGIKYPVVKLDIGGDGASVPVDGSLPVSQSGSWSVTVANASLAVTQSGAWSVSLTGTGAVNLSQYGGSAVGASNAVHVQAGTGATWTVTNAGTFAVQAAQSGTWTVQPGNTQNTTPWLVQEARTTTSTRSSVSGAASDTLLLSSNSSRDGAMIYNDSSATLYLGLGTTAASTTNFTVKMAPETYYEVPYHFTGEIRGIWSSATGAARVTEFT